MVMLESEKRLPSLLDHADAIDHKFRTEGRQNRLKRRKVRHIDAWNDVVPWSISTRSKGGFRCLPDRAERGGTTLPECLEHFVPEYIQWRRGL